MVYSTKLYIGGVSHFDPLCRESLIKWLKSLSIKEKTPASFIAVEYDKGIFEKIKKQRKKFRDIAEREWPFLSTFELRLIENSLVYEADSSIEIYPNIEILWLDEGRHIADSSVVERYAEERLIMLKNYAPNNNENFLEILSRNIRSAAKFSQKIDLGRSKKFFDLLVKRLGDDICDWSIVVVGSNHANKNINGSMANHLDEAKISYSVSYL